MAKVDLPTQVDHHEFTRSLQQLSEVLAPSPELFSYLSRRLDMILNSELGDKLAGTPVDMSTTWRRDIDKDQVGHESDPKSAIVTSMLRVAARWISDGGSLRDLIDVTSRYSRWVFRRIDLELIRKFGDDTLKRDILLREDLFQLASTRREYLTLLRENCAVLGPAGLDQVITFVNSGDVDRFREIFESMMGRKPSDSDLTRHNQGWRLMWLTTLKDCLGVELASELAALQEAFPSSTSGELATPSGGPASLTDEQVQALDARGLLQFVQQRSKSDDIAVDVLVRQLTQTAANTPGLFAGAAPEDLAALDPTFVHSLLSGLEEAVRQKRTVPWSFAVALVNRAISNGPLPERGGSALDYDPDWTSAKCAAASLLSTALTGDAVMRELLDQIWNAIVTMSGDSSPTKEYEQTYGPPNMSAATMALNTVRPRGLVAAIDFSLWQRHSEALKGLEPRVAQLLEKALSDDEATSVRAVFGLRLTDLVILDESWTKKHLIEIFGERLDTALGRIAWSDFIRFNQPHQQLYALLSVYYTEATNTVGTDAWDDSVVSRLAYHLAALYVWGLLGHEEGSVLARFFEHAPLSARLHLLETLGQILAANPPPPPEVAERLRKMWQWREREATTGRGDRKELSAFGWWFGSRKMADDWAILHLQSALREAKSVHNELQVGERLAAMASTRPVDVLNIVDLVLRNDPRGWIMHSWDPVIRSAVANARAGPVDSRRVAEEFLSRLLAGGYMQYSDLAQQETL